MTELEQWETAYRAAWEYWQALHESLPVYRTPEQAKRLNAAYDAVERTKWFLDKARRNAA